MSNQIIYVVVGYNGLLRKHGAVGASKTKEGAEKIAKDNEYYLDSYIINEVFLTD